MSWILTAWNALRKPVELRATDAGELYTSAAAPRPATAVASAEVTVGLTAAAIGGSYPRGAQLLAASTNTAPIYVGGSTVTATGATRGIPIAPGDFYTPPDSVTDLSVLYAISSAAAQKLVVLGAS